MKVSDLNYLQDILNILRKILTKKDFKKVMDYMYAISLGVEFNYSNELYQRMLDLYYRHTGEKNNVVKSKLVKGSKDEQV